MREKSIKTLSPTKNSYQVLTDESDSEGDDDIGKIVKKQKKAPNISHLTQTTLQ